MTSAKEDPARAVRDLEQAEREAYDRLARVRVAFDDPAVTEAAETLWTEAAAAVSDHQAKTERSD